MFNFRLYNEATDRDDAARCWEARKQFPVAPRLIPEASSFVAADDENKLLALAVFYVAVDAPVAMLSWLVTRPELPPKIAHQAVSVVIEGALYCLDDQRIELVLSRLSNHSVLPILERQGFTPTHEVKTEMARVRTFPPLQEEKQDETI